MSKDWNQRLFDNWLSLRKKLKAAKQSADYHTVIELCLSILSLDKQAKFIQIMTPLFYKELGNAYLKLNDQLQALHYLEIARVEFVAHRKNNELQHADDWLKDVTSLETKIQKIKTNLNRKATS